MISSLVLYPVFGNIIKLLFNVLHKAFSGLTINHPLMADLMAPDERHA